MSFFDHVFRLGYSRDLHQQLKGLSSDCASYSGGAVYQITGIIMITVSLLLMLNYYYGLFNNPRFTHRRVWLINILVACVLTGGFAYFHATTFLPEEKHCPDIHFSVLDCALFGFTTALYTALTCILFSMIFKWKSIANKKVPF